MDSITDFNRTRELEAWLSGAQTIGSKGRVSPSLAREPPQVLYSFSYDPVSRQFKYHVPPRETGQSL